MRSILRSLLVLSIPVACVAGCRDGIILGDQGDGADGAALGGDGSVVNESRPDAASTGSRQDASLDATSQADAAAQDATGETTPACVAPTIANLDQPDPTNTGCWSQLVQQSSSAVFPMSCPGGDYYMTCGDPSGNDPQAATLRCSAPVDGPPHNRFYCCPCGPITSAVDGGSDGGGTTAITDASPILDAHFDVESAPTGLAGFAFIVNGVVQQPMTCPSDNWEFPMPPGEGSQTPTPPLPGISSAVVVNTSALPMPYLFQASWLFGVPYPPGVATGNSYQLSGVLAPGGAIDITSVYEGGCVGVLGSALPFSDPDAGKYVGDEGTIPWPGAVAGSNGSSTMYVAQIDVPVSPPSSCTAVMQGW